jgi:DNA-binding NarL/FixJ family response regulator
MDRSKCVALIADPDEFFRIALRTILIDKLAFSSVVEATSLDEALEKLSQDNGVSLALFELGLPDIKSAACLAAVRVCFPNIRTAVVSKSDRKHEVLMALEAGVHGFVPKGIGPVQLTGALKLILDGQIYVPSTVATLSSPSEEMQLMEERSSKNLPVDGLTPRQMEVLQLLIQGKSNKEIAKNLRLGEGTIKVHMAALFRAFGVNSRAAVAVAGSQLMADS